MSRRRRYLPVERLRRGLLLVLLVFLGVLLGIYLYRRSRPPETAAAPEPLVARGAAGREVVLEGRGFEYELADGQVVTFRIAAERIVTDSANVVVLEQARIRIAGPEGAIYTATGQRATYELETSMARLDGDVVLTSDDGLSLSGEAIELIDDGDAVISRGAVTFELGRGYRGRADNLLYDLDAKMLTLEGNVRISNRGRSTGAESGSLRSNRLIAERQTGLLRAEGGVVLTRGESVLRARRLSAQFIEDEERLEFVRARWNVSGAVRPASGRDLGTSYSFSGRALSVLFDEQGRTRRAELEGHGAERAWLEALQDGGFARAIEAPVLEGDFADGEPQIVRAYDGVEIRESIVLGDRTPLKRVCAEWALVAFDRGGTMEQLVVQNDFDYQEQGTQATGHRFEAASAALTGRATLAGDPAWVRTADGAFAAPEIDYGLERGEMTATGGVRAELPPRGKLTLVGEETDEVIRVTAKRAEWSEEPSEFRFVGQVRAWQQKTYLLAERIIGEQGGDRLRAEGSVKTVAKPEPEAAAEAGEGEPPALAVPGEPIEVTANELTYERKAKLLTYSGSVEVHQAGRTLKCSTMDVELSDEERFERMVCKGAVVIENPDRGHKMTGSQAVYVPSAQEIEVTGSPVVMTDREGGQLRGGQVLYDLESGKARVRTASATPPAEAVPR